MEDSDAKYYLDQLNKYCREIAFKGEGGKHSDKIFDIAAEKSIPPTISQLAESFAMLIMSIEARQVKLEETIAELEIAKGRLEEYSKLLENKVASKEDELKTIRRLLLQSESQNLEFKSSARWDYRQEKPNKELEKVILKTIAGFMNAEGGILLIGVDDDGNPLGLKKDYSTLRRKDSDGFEQFLISLVSRNIGRVFCQNISINFYDMGTTEVCSITVKPNQNPVFIDKLDGAFYVRTGNSTQKLNPRETTEYISKRSGSKPSQEPDL